MQRVQDDGDPRAFAVVFDRHAAAAVSPAYRTCGGRSMGEDEDAPGSRSEQRSHGMSGTPRETRDCGGDPAAYVLGALEPEEVDTFRAHMETCVVCRDEVVAFERTADALALAVPQYRAPRGLRRRVLRVVRAEARGQPAHAQPAPGVARPHAASRQAPWSGRARRALAPAWLAGRPARVGLALA